jgi:hypothetical protein
MGRSATARGGPVLAGAGDRNRTLSPRPIRARPGAPRLARPRAVNVRQPLSIAALALALAAGCSSTSSTSTSAPPSTSAPGTSAAAAPLGCAWYTPVGGQVVNVDATGPVCASQALVGWLVAKTARRWITESVIPGSFGELLAVERKGGSAAWVYFTGPEPSATSTGSPPERTQTGPPAAVLAGTLADELAAAGWSAQP